MSWFIYVNYDTMKSQLREGYFLRDQKKKETGMNIDWEAGFSLKGSHT